MDAIENLPQQKLVLIFPMMLLLCNERQWNLQGLNSLHNWRNLGKRWKQEKGDHCRQDYYSRRVSTWTHLSILQISHVHPSCLIFKLLKSVFWTLKRAVNCILHLWTNPPAHCCCGSGLMSKKASTQALLSKHNPCIYHHLYHGLRLYWKKIF